MEQITIGVLVNTHGLRGEVKIKTMTDFPHIRFEKGSSCSSAGRRGAAFFKN